MTLTVVLLDAKTVNFFDFSVTDVLSFETEEVILTSFAVVFEDGTALFVAFGTTAFFPCSSFGDNFRRFLCSGRSVDFEEDWSFSELRTPMIVDLTGGFFTFETIRASSSLEGTSNTLVLTVIVLVVEITFGRGMGLVRAVLGFGAGASSSLNS